MRIAHVVPAGTLPGSGILTVIAHLSAALARRGPQVEVWQLSPWPADETRDRVAVLEDAGVEIVPIHVASTLRLGPRAAGIIASRRPDVVHLHSAFSPTNNWIARRLTAPYIVSPHGGYAPESLRRHALRKAVFGKMFELPMLRHAARICALTEVEAEEMRQLGISTPVSVIPNGAAPPPPDIDRLAFRRDLGLDQEKLAVFAGRLDIHHKGLDDLVRGIAAAPGWHLALVGPDFRRGDRKLRKLAASLGATNRVHIVGPRYGRPLHEALAAADIFTLMSRWEGSPMALLEALSHGTPALVSEAVERRVGVAAAGGGWVVGGDEIAERLQRVGRLDATSRTGRRASAATVAAAHSWPAVSDSYDSVYRAEISVLEG